MDGRRARKPRKPINLDDELRRIDRELNGPKAPQEEPQEGGPKKPTEPPPWAGPLLLD